MAPIIHRNPQPSTGKFLYQMSSLRHRGATITTTDLDEIAEELNNAVDAQGNPIHDLD